MRSILLMASHEERRRVGIRLSVLQYLMTVVFSVLAVSFWVLQVVAAREVRGDGREQPPADARAARAARHRVRPRRPRARREPPLVQHLDRPRAHQGPEPHRPAAGRGARHRRGAASARSSSAIAASRRTGRSPIVQDATLAQVAAVTARRLDFELPDVVVEQVPTRQLSGRRWPRTCSATSAR